MEEVLTEESKRNFKNKVKRYLRLYMQTRMTEAEFLTLDVQKKYEFLKALRVVISSNETIIAQIDDIANLIKISNVSQKREKEGGKEGLTGGSEMATSVNGAGVSMETAEELLSDIINDINTEIGKKFNGDIVVQYVLRITNTAKKDEGLQAAARVNNANGFEGVFFGWLKQLVVSEFLRIAKHQDSAVDGMGEETPEEKEERKEFLRMLTKDEEVMKRIFRIFVGEVMKWEEIKAK